MDIALKKYKTKSTTLSLQFLTTSTPSHVDPHGVQRTHPLEPLIEVHRTRVRLRWKVFERKKRFPRVLGHEALDFLGELRHLGRFDFVLGFFFRQMKVDICVRVSIQETLLLLKIQLDKIKIQTVSVDEYNEQNCVSKDQCGLLECYHSVAQPISLNKFSTNNLSYRYAR